MSKEVCALDQTDVGGGESVTLMNKCAYTFSFLETAQVCLPWWGQT